MCSSQSVPQTRIPCVGRGETARTPERFTQAKAPSSESFISQRPSGDRGRPHLQASRLTQRPAVAAGVPEGAGSRAGGGTQAGSRGGGLRTWSGSTVVPRGGGWGSAGEAELGPEAPPRGCTAARPVIPLAALPGPAHLQWLRESAPAPPRPGLEPPLSRGRRRSWSCCRIPTGPPPLSLPLAGHLDPGPRTARVPETLPAQLRGPAPHGPPSRLPCPDFRLLLDPRFPSLSSPLPKPGPRWEGGGCAPCAVPAPPPVIPPAWPARVGGAGGPGRHAGGSQRGSLCLSPCDSKSAGKMRLLLRPGGTW